MTPESLKADDYRRAQLPGARCADCLHFTDNGPYRRLCRIHTYSAHNIMHVVTRNGVCDRFKRRTPPTLEELITMLCSLADAYGNEVVLDKYYEPWTARHVAEETRRAMKEHTK